MEEFEFKCGSCDEIHRGIPTFGFRQPLAAFYVPEEEKAEKVDLGDDDCVINEERFFLRGCIEIPVHGYTDPFIWGCWAELSKDEFIEYITCAEDRDRASLGPYYGFLSGDFSPYEISCDRLQVRIHPRVNGTRPFFELRPTDHPLTQEQSSGICPERVAEIYEIMVHKKA